MRADLLHVVTAIANPIRWKSRIKLYNDFEQHVLDSGAKLTVVECTYGERDARARAEHPRQLRPGARRRRPQDLDKENLLNIGIARTPGRQVHRAHSTPTFSSVARPGRPTRSTPSSTIQVIQPWSYCYDLGPNGEHIQAHRSFASLVYAGEPVVQGPNADQRLRVRHTPAMPGPTPGRRSSTSAGSSRRRRWARPTTTWRWR